MCIKRFLKLANQYSSKIKYQLLLLIVFRLEGGKKSRALKRQSILRLVLVEVALLVC